MSDAWNPASQLLTARDSGTVLLGKEEKEEEIAARRLYTVTQCHDSALVWAMSKTRLLIYGWRHLDVLKEKQQQNKELSSEVIKNVTRS
jgi:hypothetical protein